MHRSGKPVRKCHGCGLNFRDHCGVYDNPHDMWRDHRVCPGYKNEKLLAAYLADQAKLQADKDKEKRRQIAKLRRTATHSNGDRHVLISIR